MKGDSSMRFSIIIPFFNAENYLKECILSVINQTIDFRKNVHLVLVNDGSTDNSEKIVKEFKDKYPKNITYKYINNSGPATARNIGIQLLPNNTIYTTFLDSDDKLENNALEIIESFFLNNPDVNIAVLPVYYFEKKTSAIKLNNRFKNGTRIINIHNEYNSPQFYIGGVFIRNIILKKSNYQFDEKLHFWEDALFINKIIVDEGKYGVVDGSKYYYRKRKSNDSLVDTSWYKKTRYTYLIENGYFELINYSLSTYNNVIPYIQYLIIYHLKLFLFQKHSKVLLKTLSEIEKEEFVNTVKKLLSIIDDKYIIEQDTKKIFIEFLLSLKGSTQKLPEDINKINENSIHITKYKLKLFKIQLIGYFYDDNYMLKNDDKIFMESLCCKKYAERIKIDKKIKIWDYVAKDLSNSGFSIEVPIWIIAFRFGLKSKNNIVYFKKINLINKFFNKIIRFLLPKH